MDAIRVAKVDSVILERPLTPSPPETGPSKQRLTGTLHLTPHHLIFSPTSSSSTSTSEEIWIPYSTITLLTRLPQSIQGLYPLQIYTRTFESYVLLFERDRERGAEDVWQSVKDCAVASSVEQLYAFFYSLPSEATLSSASHTAHNLASVVGPLSSSLPKPTTSKPIPTSSASNGWSAFNPRSEFARQGVGSRTKAWRFTDINKDYSFCPTYPNKLVVPSRISDSVLSYAGKYRSKARIPALTYLHWANHASITRSSQPMVGLKNSRSAQDEKLVECIFSSHNFPDTAYAPPASPLSPVVTSAPLPVYGATTTNLIIDARPTTNAMANVAMGAGTENMDNYKAGKKAYLGIDNIHVMRNSLKAIVEALREAEAASAPLDRGLLRKSNWLRHTSTILDGALIIVRNVHLNASHVLIHCSDGWDRTAQLSAVAQICLDPYYRTLEGLKVLIEKDWLAFGHKFLDRSGHLSSDKLFTVTNTPEEDSDDENFGAQKAAQAFFASMQKQFTSSNSHLREISPVFHQFLDCVRQIQRQYPERFQFNEEFLVDIHYHLYSCQFGTFLFNSEHQRRVPHTGKAYMDRTVPAWDYFDGASQLSKYLNENFDRSLDDRDSRIADADQGVLLPDPKDVRFWHRLFKRGDEEMNGSKLALAQQATGAELLGAELLGPVGAGQVDPISVEGVVERVASPLHVPYAARSRGPSPTPSISTSAPDLIAIAKDPSQPLPSASSISSLPPTNPAREGTKNPLYRISRGGLPSGPSGSGWGWSQLGSGALSAIQGAAREIKTISTEAVNQIRAEGGEAQGEMWTKGDKDEVRTGIGEGRGGRDTPGTTIPRVTTRVPSEANPWSTTPTTDIPSRIPSITPPTMTTTREQPDAQIQTQSQLQPHARREASWNKNPWGEVEVNKPDIMRKASPLPALEELSLREDKKTINGGPAVAPAETVRKEELDAALGGDRNAWDPLGAM